MKSELVAMKLGCGDCSRRSLLRGLGIVAVGALIVEAGCSQSGSSLSTATGAACGTEQCIDLTDPVNKDLTAAGGAMLLDTTSDTIMVIRMSATEVVAVSAICTHAGCSMNFNTGTSLIDCPCHGSQFSTTGAVVSGPANRAVRSYSVTLTGTTITVTT